MTVVGIPRQLTLEPGVCIIQKNRYLKARALELADRIAAESRLEPVFSGNVYRLKAS